jgi:hypothetical protein
MDDLVEKLKRLAPTSSLMPFYQAKDIAADFGNRVVELMESNRQYLGEGKTPLLPVERLTHTKQQIQIALAIVIAEYVVKLAIQPSNEIRGILGAAASSSGELAWFIRHPEDRRDYFGILIGSQNLYYSWQRSCERCLKEIAGKPPESDETIGWPS